jgi:hypothetical protein
MTLEERCGGDHIIDVAKYYEETLIIHSVKGNTVEAAVTITIEAPDGSVWKSSYGKFDRVIRVKLHKVKQAK